MMHALKNDAPYLGDSIILNANANNEPMQGPNLSLNQNSFALTATGVLYISHKFTGNAWHPDGHAAGLTRQQYFQTLSPASNGAAPSEPVLAYPNVK
jgi:hypothetical protein